MNQYLKKVSSEIQDLMELHGVHGTKYFVSELLDYFRKETSRSFKNGLLAQRKPVIQQSYKSAVKAGILKPVKKSG